MTNTINRVKAILITPKTEWEVINNEQASVSKLLTGYVIPLALIPALASAIGSYVFMGRFLSFQYVLTMAIIAFISQIVSYLLTSYVVDRLAPSFNAEQDINKSAQLVAYSSTATWIGGALALIPALGVLGSFAGGIYALYLLYLGIMPLKKVPEDKRVLYIIVTVLVLFVISFVVAAILGSILLTGTAMKFGRFF